MRRQKNNFDLTYPITIFLFMLSFWPPISRADADLVTSPDQLQSGGLLFRMQQGYVVAT